jgi:hypothetical protein
MTEPRRFFPATPSVNIEPGSNVALTLKLAKEVAPSVAAAYAGPSVAVWATRRGEPIAPTTYFSEIDGIGALTGTVIPSDPTDSVAWALANDSETQGPFEYVTPQAGPSCRASIVGGGSGTLTAIATVNGVDTGPLILNAPGF